MHFKRLAVGVAVVNRLLYAIGGYDGIQRHSSAECYHPENNTWSMIAPMHTQRSGAGVAAINQFIYVVGGYDGSKQLNTVERYDTERDVWEFVASMKIARSALSVTVLDCKIYAMGRFGCSLLTVLLTWLFLGGYNGQDFLANVEIYDPMGDAWEDGEPLTSGRSGHTSAVCYQPPCTQKCKILSNLSSSSSSSSSSTVK